MTSHLNIHFADDMPAAAVEIVAPDFEIVSRIMLENGRTKTVEVPSEASFLRVHMPTGQIVTLEDPGNLDRTISLTGLMRQLRGAGKSHRAAHIHCAGYVACAERRSAASGWYAPCYDIRA